MLLILRYAFVIELEKTTKLTLSIGNTKGGLAVDSHKYFNLSQIV